MKRYGTGLIGIFALFFLFSGKTATGQGAGKITPLQVMVVDVSHGDCIWIRTPDDGIAGNDKYEGYNIIIDAGTSGRVIMEPLESAGLKPGATIDWLINSHPHSDHIGGLRAILNNYQVKYVIDPGFQAKSKTFLGYQATVRTEPGATYYSPVVSKAPPAGSWSLCSDVPCELDWGDELEVRILYSDPLPSPYDPNMSSIVLHLSYGNISFLFTGDIEGKYNDSSPDRASFVEGFLINRYTGKDKNELKSTIIKIPHHGSETSSTTPFIKAVAPNEGLLCVGNRHGLPDESVVKRYEANNCRVWRTDRLDQGKSNSQCRGDDHIMITTDGSDYLIKYLKKDEKEGKVPGRSITEMSWMVGYYSMTQTSRMSGYYSKTQTSTLTGYY